MTTPTIAIIALLLVLIVGLRIVWRKHLDDYSKPFFSFDNDQALRDVEEMMSAADVDLEQRRRVEEK